ncbi:ferredoxin [Amycolatopsis japonica]
MIFGSIQRGTRVSVDNERCEIFGFCEMEAPSTFKIGPDGKLRIRRMVDRDGLDQAISAARLCPKQAIRVKGEGAYDDE